MKYNWLSFVIFLFVQNQVIYAQNKTRIRVKMDLIIRNDSFKELYRGDLYYNYVTHTAVYRINYPSPDIWIISDSNSTNKKLKSKASRLFLESPTVLFDYIIEQKMLNLGLPGKLYQLNNVNYQGRIQVYKYRAKSAVRLNLPEIHVAYKDKIPQSVLIFDPRKGNIMMRQYFGEFIKDGKYLLPSNITYITGEGKTKKTIRMEFLEYQLDDTENIDFYK